MASELIPVPDNLGLDVTIRGLNATQQVFGRYNLRRILGRGGMGIVWLANDERLEREVALKFLPDDVFFDPAALDELKRETRRCLDLTHPHIIRIYDFIKDEQAAAISMEFIDGKTLAEVRIEKPGRVFEAEEIRGWIGSVCQALHYAHAEAGVVHRDLKPANLMLTARGQVKIADFGISQSMSDSMSRRTLRRGTSSGTLAYMSPQQLNGEVARPSDDIYALGATIYELLTGKPPFHSGDVSFQIRLGMPKSVAERRAEFGIVGASIPPGWEATLEACLAKIPAERPADMAEIAERLGCGTGVPRPIASNPEIEHPKETPPSPALSRPPRSIGPWHPAILVAAVILTLLVIAGCLLFRARNPSAKTNPGLPVVSTPVPVAPVAAPTSVVTPAQIPLVKVTTGTLLVNSDPPGAAVHIEGLKDQVTPATFMEVQPGQYHVAISAAGYEPEQSTVTVTANTRTDTGALQLRRATGDLSVSSIPPQARYVLTSLDARDNTRREGTTPDTLIGLPTGTYQIILTGTGLPSANITTLVAAHEKALAQVDLIDRSITHDASAPVISVLHGSATAASLDDSGRNELMGLTNRAFQMYLNAGLLDQASAQLEILRNLNQDTTSQQAALVAKSSAVEQGFAAEIQQLITRGKLATATERIAQLRSTLTPGAVERIAGPYRDQLAAYQSQIASTIQASAQQPPETSDEPLRVLNKKYPDDQSLLLARAQILTRMPPTGDALAATLRDFQKFALENKAFAADPALIGMEQTFAEEKRQLDAVTQALKAAKKGPASLQAEIDELEERESIYRHRRVGAPKANPFSSAINFVGKAVTGHRVVDTASYFESSEDRRDAIAEVQQHIDQDKAALAQPPASLVDAQNAYDQFLARLPWGPGSPPAPALAPVTTTAPAPPPSPSSGSDKDGETGGTQL